MVTYGAIFQVSDIMKLLNDIQFPIRAIFQVSDIMKLLSDIQFLAQQNVLISA